MAKTDKLEQLSLFDTFADLGKLVDGYSTGQIEIAMQNLENAMYKLKEAKHFAQKREKEERVRREKEQAERKAREERELKEAHVREVTCMDLPIDWENAFDSDIRTRGIHADSIPDGLILSLTNLGRITKRLFPP